MNELQYDSFTHFRVLAIKPKYLDYESRFSYVIAF